MFFFSFSEVPSVGFNRTSMVHDMRQKQLKIPVTLQPVVVREFNVTVTASPGTAAGKLVLGRVVMDLKMCPY